MTYINMSSIQNQGTTNYPSLMNYINGGVIFKQAVYTARAINELVMKLLINSEIPL